MEWWLPRNILEFSKVKYPMKKNSCIITIKSVLPYKIQNPRGPFKLQPTETHEATALLETH